MNVLTARRIVFTLLALYAVALVWPGVTLFNRIEPLVFGLPFIMFWIALWVVLVGAGFALLNAVETRIEDRTASLADATSRDKTLHERSQHGDAPRREGA